MLQEWLKEMPEGAELQPVEDVMMSLVSYKVTSCRCICAGEVL